MEMINDSTRCSGKNYMKSLSKFPPLSLLFISINERVKKKKKTITKIFLRNAAPEITLIPSFFNPLVYRSHPISRITNTGDNASFK